MTVKIKRFLNDLGNSNTFALVDGNVDNIIDIPTVVKQVDESTALGYFQEEVKAEDFKDFILVKLEGKYYLVGDAAERESGNDKHIEQLHTKSDSEISYLMYLASVAVYEAENFDHQDYGNGVDVEIDYYSNMIPIFEALQTEKFSDITDFMAERFGRPVSFEIITPGRQKTINIKVNESKCFIEGFVAKFALKYNLELNVKEAVVEKFKNHKTVNVDLGGGTIDMVLLKEGLGNPINRDAFKAITKQSYLKKVVQKLKAKFIKLFHAVGYRGVDRFIVDHYKDNSYIWKNSITGETIDLTDATEEQLRNYTKSIMPEILGSYEAVDGETYKFNYFGGVAPILRKYIKEYISELFNTERFNEFHHIEPDTTARFLNLYGLEVIARQNTLVKK